MLGTQASSNGSPRLPNGRKMSWRHRKGKQRAADLSEELSVRRALGQRPSWHHLALGPRCTALLWYFSERANQIVSFQQSRKEASSFFFIFFFLKMTGNKLMAETIRGEQSSVDLFYMSDRRECTRGPLQRFTTSLWWVLFLFLRPLHLLIPKELEEIKWMLFHLQPVLWPEMTNDLSVLWFCKRLGGKKTTTHLLFLFNDLFSILCQGWSLN